MTSRRESFTYPARFLLATPLMLLCAALWSHCRADTADPVDRLIQTFDSLRADASIPGLGVAILHESEVVAMTGLGFANLERQIPVDPDTPFRIASVTKPLSATLALQLREQGLLDLEAPMIGFADFPELCTEAKAAGGIFFDDWSCDDPRLTLRHVLSMTANGPPGTKFFYNPVSYSWASRPMSQAVDSDFSIVFDQMILTPTQMTRSARVHRGLPLRPDLASDLATPYHLDEDSRVVQSEPPGPQGDGAAGGVVSTIRDLVAFDIALDRGELLAPAVREEMWSRQSPSIPYGIGWFATDVGADKVVWHTGLWEGAYSALYLKIPERRVTLILLANSDGLRWETGLDEAALERSPFARALFEVIERFHSR